MAVRRKKRTQLPWTIRLLWGLVWWGWRLVRWLFGRSLRGNATRRKRLVTVVLLALLYFSSPFYWVSEAVYFESLGESRLGQDGVRHVLANRKGNPAWPGSFRQVILDGAERGNYRDFTYRDHHAWHYLPDGTPIPPVIHAIKTGNLDRLVVIHLDSVWFLVKHYVGVGSDPTYNAVFYKVQGHASPYFARQIRRGKMCPTVQIGAHVFYDQCR